MECQQPATLLSCAVRMADYGLLSTRNLRTSMDRLMRRRMKKNLTILLTVPLITIKTMRGSKKCPTWTQMMKRSLILTNTQIIISNLEIIKRSK